MSTSKIYGASAPNRDHITRAGGVAGEVAKLRNDVENSLGIGIQYLHLTDISDPVQILTPSGLSIVQNDTGDSPQVLLPNGVDGATKRIVNGINGQNGGSGFFFISMTNNLGNDFYDMVPGSSVDLAWVGDLGGWVATSYCGNVNVYWD